MLQYDRLIIRIEACAGPRGYQVSVEGEEGEGHGHFELPFEGRDIENFVLRMSRGRGTRRVETSESERAKRFGRELFAALFQGEVRDVYRSCLADARRQNRGLRVTLALTKAPELMDVPWEYLYDEPDFLAVSAWTPVVRYLDVARPKAPLPVSPPLRVLGMISDVVDLPRLDVEGERQRLEAALRPLRTQGRVEVHWTQAATLDALLRKLHHGDFHILHFVGHGGYDETREDGVLLFQGPDGRSHEITGERLATILQDHRSLRLVVLNACEGARSSQSDPFAGVAASLVQRGIPAVVAMQFEITDDAALTFAAYFYAALAQGDPVDGAVAHARLGIFASGNDVEWGTPVLFLRSADGRVFDLQGEQARSQEAELSLTFEAHPTVAAVGEPITWSLQIQNVGTPSLFRATPRNDAGRPLANPVDLMSGEDAVFTWSSTAELGPAPAVSVTASEASGREVHAHAQARLEVQPPTPAMVLTLRPEPAQAAIEEEILWRLSIRGTGPATLSDVVAEDAAGQQLNAPIEVPAGEERDIQWTSPARPTRDERVLVRACDDRGRTLSESVSATVTIVESSQGSEPLPQPPDGHTATAGGAARGGADTTGSVAGSARVAALLRGRRALVGVAATGVAAIGVVLFVLSITGHHSPKDPRPSKPSRPAVVADNPIPVGSRPNALTIAGGMVWALSGKDGMVWVIDPGTGKPVDRIDVGKGGTSVAAGFDSVWVAKARTDTLLRIHTHAPFRRSGTALHIPTEPDEEPVAVATGEGAVWIGVRNKSGAGAVIRLDPKRGEGSMQRIRIDGGVQDLAVGDGAVWVSTRFQPTVVPIGANNQPQTPIPVNAKPQGLAVRGNSVWVASAGANAITRITASSRRRQTIPIKHTSSRITVGAGSIWVTARDADRLIGINPHGGHISRMIKTGRQPYALDVSHQSVWLSLLDENAVQRVRVRP